jgi:hypothetical protein
VGGQSVVFYPLCKQTTESVRHLLVECKYSILLGATFKNDRASPTFNQTNGMVFLLSISGETWRVPTCQTAKSLHSSPSFVTWKIWNKHNARVLNDKYTLPLVLLEKIKKGSPFMGYRGSEAFRSNHFGRATLLCFWFGSNYLVKTLILN